MSTTQALFKLQSLYWESVYETCTCTLWCWFLPVLWLSCLSKPHWSSQPHSGGLSSQCRSLWWSLGPSLLGKKTSAVGDYPLISGLLPWSGVLILLISIPLIGLVVLYSLYIYLRRKSFLLVLSFVSDRSVDSCDFGMPRS